MVWSQAEDESFLVKDSVRTLHVLLEDIENVAGLIHAMPKLFPLPVVQSIRMLFHGVEGHFGQFLYRLLSGGRNYIEDVFLSTVETADRLVKRLRLGI